MTERVHHYPNLIYSLGTQVVTLVPVLGQSGKVPQPRGSVGVVTYAPPRSERLRAELEPAYQDSKMPEAPTGASALNDLLVRVRLGNIVG